MTKLPYLISRLSFLASGLMLLFINWSCIDADESTSLLEECDILNYRIYQGEQLTLGEVSREFIFIGIDKSYTDEDISDFLQTQNFLDQGFNFTIHEDAQYQFKQIPVRLNRQRNCSEISVILESLEGSDIIAYAHPTFETDDCQDAIGNPVGEQCVRVYVSSFFVRVPNPEELTALQELIASTNTEWLGANQFMSNWHEIRATKNSQGDALEMANFFLQSGVVNAVDPGIGIYPVR
ncbi:hypothetical protein [Mongoliitalea lutea]|nr:hypothetical protein [Mongoliitalea lutea]